MLGKDLEFVDNHSTDKIVKHLEENEDGVVTVSFKLVNKNGKGAGDHHLIFMRKNDEIITL